MTHITIGKAGRKKAGLLLDILLRTRLLIQANSGGGKSWLLRMLAEQLFGKIQVIIIDPEGEFASLREKFGFVLVGKGGETPADPRSAALVAHRLLELRASAVCDLFEMKPTQRHTWVKNFLEAMIDAPKKLWHPVVVIVDEAHVFAPEKGAGESEASEAMISLATRGRKRGFCAVFATQRLGKLRKDAAAEMQNILVGPTFMDIDRKRAADALGVPKKEERDFYHRLRLLEPGQFYSLGRAISKDLVLIQVGDVQTSHPEPGSYKHAAEPPPPPAKIKKLLPKLSDLPREAEEKAKTVAEFRKEIRSLKAQVRSRPAETREVKVADPKAIERAVTQRDRELRSGVHKLEQAITRLQGSLQRIVQEAAKAAGVAMPKIDPPKAPEPVKPGVVSSVRSSSGMPAKPLVSAPFKMPRDFKRLQNKILTSLAEFEAIGRAEIPRTVLAARCECSYKGGHFNNTLGSLRTIGVIEYGSNKTVLLTEEGRSKAPSVEVPLSTEEMFASCLALVKRKLNRDILQAVYSAYPESVSREDLAEGVGATASGGHFGNTLGSLRSFGMIKYLPEKRVRCADWIFID